MTKTLVALAIVAATTLSVASPSLAASGSTRSYAYLASGIGGDMAATDNTGGK
jgi:hypothetical protein